MKRQPMTCAYCGATYDGIAISRFCTPLCAHREAGRIWRNRHPPSRPQRPGHLRSQCASCTTEQRWCSGCHEHRAITQFARHQREADGLQPYCKRCKLEQERRYRQRLRAERPPREPKPRMPRPAREPKPRMQRPRPLPNPDRQIAALLRTRQRQRLATRAYDARHPEKARARSQRSNAMRADIARAARGKDSPSWEPVLPWLRAQTNDR